MSVIKGAVFLLKSEIAQDNYKDLLEANNFEVTIIRTLVFQYKNLDSLRKKLSNVEDYSGIVFSSPRCVEAVSQTLNKDLIPIWNRKNNYVVGEASFELAQELGIFCEGKESGNAKNLSQLILQNKQNIDRPLLFPHGNLKSNTLNIELSKEKITLEEVLVYDTLPNPSIQAEITKSTNNFTCLPEFLVYFSPSGVNVSIEYFRKNFTDLSAVKIIAIGPVTELAVTEKGLKIFAVAASPTPEDILKVIL